MKTVLSICIFAVFSYNGMAQTTEIIKVKGVDLNDFISNQLYKYKVFSRAKVYFKNGETGSAKMNFNYMLPGLQFININKDTVVLDNASSINYVTILTDTFFYNDGYLEWMASSPKAKLTKRVTLTLVSSEPVGAFGTTTNTRKVESVGVILQNTVYKLGVNEELEFKKKTLYFISGPDNMFVEANKKNIIRMFPGKNVEEYIKENKLNLNKQENIVDLFYYLNN